MKIHNTPQGSDAWHKLRAQHFNASEAPAMLGLSKKCKRTELLQMRATCTEREFSDWVQKNVLDKGLEAEAAARPIAEKIIGEELFPMTVTEDFDDMDLLASLDGMTVIGDVLWEHKLWSEALAAQIKAKKLDPEYEAQLEQQLMVTSAKKTLFMASDGTKKKCAWMWYTPHKTWAKKIIAGWKQMKADIAEYKHVEPEVVPEGRAPEQLPALRIELTGTVTASNLIEFKQTAMSVIGKVNTDLQTDVDFANAEKAVKWCGDVESRLDAAKDHALGQTASIDELFRALDEIKAEARAKRLDLEKLVKRRKETIRVEIQQKAEGELRAHYEQINITLDGSVDLSVPHEFRATVANAMKGKKTVSSLRDAADTALANAKISASEQADLVRVNLKTLQEHKGHGRLFPDARLLVTTKAADDFKAIVTSRIAEHEAAEEKRLETERERIREEEQQKAREKVDEEERERTRILEEEERRAEEAAEKEKPAPQAVQPATQPVKVGIDPAGADDTTVVLSSPCSERPTDAQIVEVLASHFHVDEPTVIKWLRDMVLPRQTGEGKA
jgi:predicted phage-related endonuclease